MQCRSRQRGLFVLDLSTGSHHQRKQVHVLQLTFLLLTSQTCMLPSSEPAAMHGRGPSVVTNVDMLQNLLFLCPVYVLATLPDSKLTSCSLLLSDACSMN